MLTDTITWTDLPRFHGKSVIIFGTDKPCADLADQIKTSHPEIRIEFFLDTLPSCDHEIKFKGLPVISPARAVNDGLLDGKTIIIAKQGPMPALNSILDARPESVHICSRQLHSLFNKHEQAKKVKAVKTVHKFCLERDTPKIPAIVTNAYQVSPPTGENIFEIADFARQEYTRYTIPGISIPVSLAEFSQQVPQETLPMRMSHLSYLLWKKSFHVTQLSPSGRYFIGVRYNFFHLDILDTQAGELIRWHDLPESEGLWDYVATGDFDGDKDEFLFVRWPLRDAINGMIDGTNKVHCQVGRLHLDTMKAEILHEFDFQDRIHQCTISADGKFMVFAPMRVLRPGGDPKKLRQEDIMRNLQQTVVLDDMATLELATGRFWRTKIPYPIPAHFELDPYDPEVFYVSTHSLMPHSTGVVCFQPGTLHKMRIGDGETVLEGTYSHPGFIRTTQHCVFGWQGKAYIAATNQNKLEIIDAARMELWHCHRLGDDPYYDNANFSDPEFLRKPFDLPPQPAWCDSVSATGDGAFVIMHLMDKFCIFSMAEKKIVGNVAFCDKLFPTSHGRYWMQNAAASLQLAAYAKCVKC